MAQQQQLIPGLPDDIAMQCVVRVPHQFHSSMNSVCHRWHDIVSHPSFYDERRLNHSKELVVLVQPFLSPGPPQHNISIFNITSYTWHITGPNDRITIPLFSQCLALPESRKILLVGGWDTQTWNVVPHVYILELINGSYGWQHGASMSVARSFFASAVVENSKVYVAGGHDIKKDALKSVKVYDVELDKWKLLPDMAEDRDECQGLTWKSDSKFWDVNGYGIDS